MSALTRTASPLLQHASRLNAFRATTLRVDPFRQASQSDRAACSAGGPRNSTQIGDVSIENLFKSSAAKLEPSALLEELADTQLLGKRGEVWFAAQAGLLLLLLFPPAPLEALVRIGGVAGCGVGLALTLAGVQSLGNSLSPFPAPRRDEHELITDGVYEYVRHPMYGGLLLLAFGFSAATGSDLRFAASFALFYVLNQKVQLEEEALEEKYADYSVYKKTAKRFIPFIY